MSSSTTGLVRDDHHELDEKVVNVNGHDSYYDGDNNDDSDLVQFMEPVEVHENWFNVRHLLLFVVATSALTLLVGLSVAEDLLHRQRHKIVRQINAAFEPAWTIGNETYQALVIVEHTYSTREPQNPYYDDPYSAEHVTAFYRCNNPHNLHDRVLIVRFNEDAGTAGNLAYSHIYYMPFEGRIVCSYRGVPSVIRFSNTPDMTERDAQGINFNWNNVMKALDLTSSNVINLFGQVPQGWVRSIIRHNPVPSPNGHLVAAMVTVNETADGVTYSLETAVTFYDIRNLLYLGGRRLEFVKSDQLDLHLIPAATNNVSVEDYYCLWSPDSTGVYVLDRSDAWFVRAVIPYSFDRVINVPKFAVNTISGVVNDQGMAAQIYMSGNNATIVYSQIDGWIPFNDVPLVPHGSELYSELVPGINYTFIKG